MAYSQDNRLIAITTPLGNDVLLLSDFHATEGISQLFQIELSMISENHAIAFEDVIGENVTISVVLANEDKRYFNGIVAKFSQGRGGGDEGGDPRFSVYWATVVPWTWLLTRTTDCRIFQKMTGPEIVEKVFTDNGFRDYSLKLQGNYSKRDFCVQYQETDFNFISRIMEEEGIYYFFEHEDGMHTMVLADASAEHKPCPHQKKAFYQLSGDAVLDEDVIQAFEKTMEIKPVHYTHNDYNFEIPSSDLKVNIPGKHILGSVERGIYDYPGLYGKRDEGDRLARIRIEEQEAGVTSNRGKSNCRAFASGYRFSLAGFYRKDMNNKDYVLTALEHRASQGWDDRAELSYANSFSCIPYDIPFRPPRTTERPFVRGSQTAVVVGPAGEEIYTDEHGRVKVQFHWDREGKKNENSSFWIRVSQIWAGAGWGGIFIPRIGQEVIVEFLEGNPDRPIITGRVYNAHQPPPYELPANATQSGVKTRSSKGGSADNYNEIRFEDKKGSEQILVHAEKDMDITIEANENRDVGGDRKVHVSGHFTENIDSGETRTVLAGSEETISGGAQQSISGGMRQSITSGMKQSIEGGMKQTITAGETRMVSGGLKEAIIGNEIRSVSANMSESIGGNLQMKMGGTATIMSGGPFTISAPVFNLIAPTKNGLEGNWFQYGLYSGTAYGAVFALAGISAQVAAVSTALSGASAAVAGYSKTVAIYAMANYGLTFTFAGLNFTYAAYYNQTAGLHKLD
jgi:type VI secretion system secreted protein VgrG